MRQLRIGVSGSGFMGRTHVDAAHRLESTQIVAVTGGSRAEALAADYKIALEPSVAALVARDDIDALVIATPHHLHCEEALAAADLVARQGEAAASLEDQPCPQGCAAKILDKFH